MIVKDRKARYSVPKIKKGDRVIIGLGDSFTQGVGAYTEETWAKNNYRIDVGDESGNLLKQRYEHSWVKVLADKLGYKAINLGHAGTGNRCAVKELYLNNIPYENISEGIVVYMISGLERFDFAQKENYQGHNFIAMWPNPRIEDPNKKPLWTAYNEYVYSDYFVTMELLLNLYEAQVFCKAHGFKLIITSAFDQRLDEDWLANKLDKTFHLFSENKKHLVNQVDWDTVCYPKGRSTFIELLLEKEGYAGEELDLLSRGMFYQRFCAKDKPGHYITNCAHPTIEGHKIIANELYNFIIDKKYV